MCTHELMWTHVVTHVGQDRLQRSWLPQNSGWQSLNPSWQSQLPNTSWSILVYFWVWNAIYIYMYIYKYRCILPQADWKTFHFMWTINPDQQCHFPIWALWGSYRLWPRLRAKKEAAQLAASAGNCVWWEGFIFTLLFMHQSEHHHTTATTADHEWYIYIYI